MFPEPYLLAHKAVNPKLSRKTVHLLKLPIIRNTIIREDIDKYAVVDIHIPPNLLHEQSIVLLDLSEVEWSVALSTEPLKEVLLAQLGRGNLEKTVVVLTGHTHIYIVIPRHNALIVEGTYSTTSLNEVWNIILLTDTVYLSQNFVQYGM